MMLSVIAAMDRNGVIGKDNTLPWRLPADLQHFKRLTLGKPIVMGRATRESIGRSLPGRTNVVISRDARYRASGCVVVRSLEEALAALAGQEEVMIIGGASLYAQTLGRAEHLYLTLIDAEVQGNVYFPALDYSQWIELERETHEPDPHNPHRYSFVRLQRRPALP